MARIARRPRSAVTPDGSRIAIREVESWSEFVDIIEGWPGFRNWCFRGQGQEDWKLTPSLTRHIEVARVAPGAWRLQEMRIARIFQRKCHLFLEQTPDRDDALEWLALMQHHGAPTRLLDFTWSPYVAAFFALERASRNAAVWALNLPLLWDTHSRYRIEAPDPRREFAEFDRHYVSNKHDFVWQGDPYHMPQRVVAQSGTFLVLGRLGTTVEEILKTYPGKGTLLIKFVLNTAALRSQAMASLYSMNITQATLYPGLDGLARSMYYEFEYSWQVDPTTNEPLPSLVDPRLPDGVLARVEPGAADVAPGLADLGSRGPSEPGNGAAPRPGRAAGRLVRRVGAAK